VIENNDLKCDGPREGEWRNIGMNVCVRSNVDKIQLTMSKETYEWMTKKIQAGRIAGYPWAPDSVSDLHNQIVE
jgi:hypothetical protein